MDQKISVCQQPIFVLGCPRSGTSVTAWCLSKHSKMWASAESDFFVKIIEMGKELYEFGTIRGQRHWLSRQKVDLDEFFKYLGYGINALYTNRSKGKRWVEQTPLYSVHADGILKLFPNAQFIHIVRDGRDVVNSMINSGFNIKWSNDFDFACITFKKYSTALDDFKKRNPEKVCRIYLEKIKENPEKEFKKLCAFLNVEYEKAITNHFLKGRMNSSFKNEEDREKNSWKKAWTKKQIKTFDEHCSDVMKLYGYY